MTTKQNPFFIELSSLGERYQIATVCQKVKKGLSAFAIVHILTSHFVIRKLFSISHDAFFPYKRFTKYATKRQGQGGYDLRRPMDENNKTDTSEENTLRARTGTDLIYNRLKA